MYISMHPETIKMSMAKPNVQTQCLVHAQKPMPRYTKSVLLRQTRKAILVEPVLSEPVLYVVPKIPGQRCRLLLRKVEPRSGAVSSAPLPSDDPSRTNYTTNNNTYH